MSQDPYTTRRDFAVPGRPAPEGAEGGQDGADVTPPLGAAYPDERPPAIEFAQTVRDPVPASDSDADPGADSGSAPKTVLDAPETVLDAPRTLLDQTRPVPLPQQGPPAGDAPRDIPVAPLPLPQQVQQAQQAPPPQPQAQQPQPQQPAQPPQAQPPQGFGPTPGLPPQGHFQQQPAQGAPAGGAWHRQHYAIGIFLVLYGLTNLVTGLLGFSNRKMEVALYFGEGLAAPVLVVVKCVEALLLAVTAGGLLRRKDVWFLPALLAWVAGFAVLCVLDLVKGEFLTLAEHLVYTLLFGFLLFLSYALSAKVRAAGLPGPDGPQAPAAQPAGPVPAGVQPGAPQGAPGPTGLSRTQEIALNTLNRWQRGGR
jgi:hypothetical protein